MHTVYTYPTIYSISIIVGLFYYKKYSQNLFLRYFLYFLIYSLFTEIIGAYFGIVLRKKNFFIFNSWIILSCVFYLFFFLNKIESKKKRNLIKGIIVLFMSLTSVNIIFFKNYFQQGLVHNNILGKIFIVIAILIYFTELLKSDAILHIGKTMYFWISLGIFIYAIGFIPVYVIAEYISYSGIFRIITLVLNILMAGCFITGFIVSKKEFNN